KPPLLFFGAVVVGLLLSLALPIGPGLGSANGLAVTVGLIFIVIGFALAAFSVRTFSRAGADVVPGRPATTLVTKGPYRVTRNPIYIGFTLLYFGIAILATSIWMLLLLVPLLIVLQRGVVLREEAYLETKFGETYEKYQAHVPRWL
ncbi:MAG: isoprenylcysteine carboxylmethyltransferase family protein, partial [Methyloceanibacter sp.]|nr:isoprenylcysteine carboxylmethyltransferase family protein [Methyloceanibacter sp.]